MSGVVPASIETIVNDLKDITWEQVIFEAVTNSLQANAIEVNITFNYLGLDLSDDKNSIDQLVIEDNGDGFTADNIKSFQNYRSNFKKELGCKGIGRFLYLKIFKMVNIKSLKKEIKFVINKDIKVSELENEVENTKVVFNEPNTQIVVDYDELEQKIRDHFIAYFKLLNREITIKIFENRNIKRILKE